jgi:hypothetical protein
MLPESRRGGYLTFSAHQGSHSGSVYHSIRKVRDAGARVADAARAFPLCWDGTSCSVFCWLKTTTRCGDSLRARWSELATPWPHSLTAPWRSSDPDIKVMFITGFAAVSLNTDAAAPKDAKVLSKPFHLKDLVREVDRLLAA